MCLDCPLSFTTTIKVPSLAIYRSISYANALTKSAQPDQGLSLPDIHQLMFQSAVEFAARHKLTTSLPFKHFDNFMDHMLVQVLVKFQKHVKQMVEMDAGFLAKLTRLQPLAFQMDDKIELFSVPNSMRDVV